MRAHPLLTLGILFVLTIAGGALAVAATADTRLDAAMRRLERGADQLQACRDAGERIATCSSGERSLSQSRGTLTSDVFGVGSFSVTVGRGDRRTYACASDSDRCERGRWMPSS